MKARPAGQAVLAATPVALCGVLLAGVIVGCSAGRSGQIERQPVSSRDALVTPLSGEQRGRRAAIAIVPSHRSAVPIIQGVNLGDTVELYCKEAFTRSPNYKVLVLNAPSAVEVILKVSVSEFEREVTFDKVAGRWVFLPVAGGSHERSEKIGVVQVVGELMAPASGEVIASVRGYGRLEEIEAKHEGGFGGQRVGSVSRTRVPPSTAAREAVFDMARHIDQVMVEKGAWRPQ